MFIGGLGADVTPDATCSRYELHVSGDIALAALQYLYATNSTEVLRNSTFVTTPVENLYEVLRGIATFWRNKLTFNKHSKKYEISGQCPLLRTLLFGVYSEVYIAEALIIIII